MFLHISEETVGMLKLLETLISMTLRAFAVKGKIESYAF